MNAVDKADEGSGQPAPHPLDLTFDVTLQGNAGHPGILFRHIISNTENVWAKVASVAIINGKEQRCVKVSIVEPAF